MNDDKYLNFISQNYNAVDKGHYFLCTCPNCNKKEAFIYKNNPQWLTCNRTNNCNTIIKINLAENIKPLKLQVDEKELLKNDIKEGNRNFLGGFIKYHAKNNRNNRVTPQRLVSRGLSKELLDKHRILFIDGGIQRISSLEQLRYCFHTKHRSDYYKDRNIILPIYDENDNLDRLLLRADDPTLEPKEIQFKLHYNATENWNTYELLNTPNKYIAISEGIIDGISIEEVDRDITPIGVMGARKYKKLVELISKNIDLLKDKEFILAFDNDKTGIEYGNLLQLELLKLGLKAKHLDLTTYKDVNEMLLGNKQLLHESISKVKEELGMTTAHQITNEILSKQIIELTEQLVAMNSNQQHITSTQTNQQQGNDDIKVNVTLYNKGKIKALCNIKYHEMTIAPVKLIEGAKGCFLSFPCYEQNGEFKDYIKFDNNTRSKITNIVLKEYERQVQNQIQDSEQTYSNEDNKNDSVDVEL